jgi:hypothetical protein
MAGPGVIDLLSITGRNGDVRQSSDCSGFGDSRTNVRKRLSDKQMIVQIVTVYGKTQPK